MIRAFGPSVSIPYSSSEVRSFRPGEDLETRLPHVEVHPLGISSHVDQSRYSVGINIGGIAAYAAADHMPEIEVVYILPNPDEPPIRRMPRIVDGGLSTAATIHNRTVSCVMDKKARSLALYINSTNLHTVALDCFWDSSFAGFWIEKLDKDTHKELYSLKKPLSPKNIYAAMKAQRTRFFCSIRNISEEQIEQILKKFFAEENQQKDL